MEYTPKYKILSATIIFNGQKIEVDGNDIANGAYRLKEGGFLSNYTYIPKRNIVAINGSATTKNIISGLYVKTSALISDSNSLKSAYNVKYMNLLLPPSEVFNEKHYPEMTELAEKVVFMKQNKTKVSEYNQYAGELFTMFYQEISLAKGVNLEYMAYLFFWYNSHVLSAQKLNKVFDGVSSDLGYNKTFQKIFDQLPYKPYKVKQIKTGKFLSNKAEQKILSQFAGKDELRPIMTMSYIDDGYAVSTNAHVLLAIYDKSLKGKEKKVCYQKICDGFKFDKETIYPKWRNVLLKGEYETFEVDTKDLLDELKKIETYNFYLDTTNQLVIDFKNVKASYNVYLLTLCIRSMYELGHETIYLHIQSPNRALMITTIADWSLDADNSTMALTMPVMMLDELNSLHENINLKEAKEIKIRKSIFKDGGQTNAPNLIKSKIHKTKKS